jgi:hypothetical protein
VFLQVSTLALQSRHYSDWQAKGFLMLRQDVSTASFGSLPR